MWRRQVQTPKNQRVVLGKYFENDATHQLEVRQRGKDFFKKKDLKKLGPKGRTAFISKHPISKSEQKRA